MSNFKIVDTPLPDVKVIETRQFADDRGFFSETWSELALADLELTGRFVQDNQSLSMSAGTLRGVHFQTPPYAQTKLVRVITGRVWDVAVDLRRSSPTFKQWFGVELSAENGLQLWVPAGFGHGFLTLVPNTIVAYKVSAPYAPAHDAGVFWQDRDLDIGWPRAGDRTEPVLSVKDQALPRLSSAPLFD